MASGTHIVKKVQLVQINNSFSNQNYLPYSVGLLQAFVQKHSQSPDQYEFLLPIYKRISVDDAVQKVLGADIIGFSTYVWNIRVSLEIAKRVKEIKPETLIIFGGPQVPDQAENFIRQNPFIDLCCHGEGEQVFLDILENSENKDWADISSVSYLDGEAFITHPKKDRIKDLSIIPSPLIENTFEPLLQANPDEKWLVLWETNRGCPFSCTFCDWGSSTASKVYRFDIERLFKEIDWFADHEIEFVFCCDANFGILGRDLELAQYVANTKEKRGYPHALSVQNTKNATERAYQTQKTLNMAGLNKGVTIALQTIDEGTLKSIKRDNISTDTYQELQKRFTNENVETYTDIILGLPGETYQTYADGVARIIENGQHNRIQFNNLSILPNAEMGDPEYQKRYGMETVETKIVNIHGFLDDAIDDIYEVQDLVIATNTMPKEDWVKTRVFSWMTSLLHFNKVLQIPLVLLHENCSISYRELMEMFLERDLSEYPVLAGIQTFFVEKAKDIQMGGAEYCASKEWLNIWWPADEYALIKICREDTLEAFYQECEEILKVALKERFLDFPDDLLREAIDLNKSLLKLPFVDNDLTIDVSYNILEYYRCVVSGNPILLEAMGCRYIIDRKSVQWHSWDQWCQEVIWYGNKKGAYLYGNDAVERQVAGHF